MNEFEQCIDEWATRCREKDAQITSLQAALDAEREKGQAIIKDTKNMIDVATRSLWEQLTQLQALVRALLDTWVNGRKIHDGIPMTLRQQIDATLDATTPAECPDCDGDGAVDSGGTDPNGNPLMRRCGCREKGGDDE